MDTAESDAVHQAREEITAAALAVGAVTGAYRVEEMLRTAAE
jgi:hypothetical protein